MISLKDNNNNSEMILLSYQLSKTKIPKQLVERGLKYLDITTELQAQELLILNYKGKWNHPFIPMSKEYKVGELCLVCRDKFINHYKDDNLNRSHSVSGIGVNRNNISIKDNKEAGRLIDNRLLKRRTSLPLCTMPLAVPNHYSYCPICLGNDCSEMNSLPCSHQFCNNCFIEYIQNMIYNAKIDLIKCPDNGCSYPLEEEFVLSLLDDDYIAKYKIFKRRNEIEKVPNAIICPFPNCESFALRQSNNSQNKGMNELDNIVIEVMNEEVLTCIDNHHHFCSKCHQQPHIGENCNARLDRNFEEWKKKKKTKKCPKCKTEIEKLGGCNHMTCTKRNCNYNFCWICLGKYSSNHYSNPLTPCFQMQYRQKESICDKCRILMIILRLIGFILLFFLALVWPILIILIPSILALKEKVSFKYPYQVLLFFVTYFLLAIALIPLGFICLFGFIAALPLILVTGGVYMLYEVYL